LNGWRVVGERFDEGGHPMNWNHSPEDESALQAAFVEIAQSVGQAFIQAVGRFGYVVDGPLFGHNPDEKVSRWVSWWIDIPSPYESMSCEMDMLVSSDGAEVSGRIATWRYIAHGYSDSDDVWRADDILVESPAAAIAAFRQVGEELVRQCGSLDLGLYVVGERSKSNVQGR
jgi:hypothetical protein